MTRSIEYRTTYDQPAERVFAALTDPEYLRERLRVLSGDNELAEFEATDDGARYRIRQGVRADAVPAVARAVVGGGLTIDRSETWRRDENGYTGEVVAGAAGVQRAITGSQVLRDLPGSGCEYVVEGTVKVSIPLIGGKLEKLFADEVRAILEAEHDFAADWLDRQG